MEIDQSNYPSPPPPSFQHIRPMRSKKSAKLVWQRSRKEKQKTFFESKARNLGEEELIATTKDDFCKDQKGQKITQFNHKKCQ